MQNQDLYTDTARMEPYPRLTISGMLLILKRDNSINVAIKSNHFFVLFLDFPVAALRRISARLHIFRTLLWTAYDEIKL